MFLKPLGAKKMVLRALKLGELPPTHREFVFIADITGAALVRKLLNAQDDTLEFPLVAAMTTKAAATETGPAAPRGFWAFLRLGVGRIWMGCDHLLFLLALLVVCRSFRSIAAILACFTLAHSLTLALATLNVVNLPGRIAGPAIAASLVFVGVENLLRRGAEPRGRWAVTFAFGLIHGFGFARVLRDVSVGAAGGQGVALPLFAFNLGVETGLIAVASIVLPIVWRLQKHPGFLRRGVPALSAVVSAAGLYWFLGRTVFS